MSNTLELSELFVCLGQLIKFFSTSGDRKIAGLWFARGISTPAGTMVYIYWFSYWEGLGQAFPPAENLFISPTCENPPSRPSPNKFLSSPPLPLPPPTLPHPPTISPSSPLNNNSHVITQ